MISLDTSGNERWVYIYNRLPQDGIDRAHSIDFGIDGNLYVAGMTAHDPPPDYSHDFTVVSLDTAGSERWIYHYNGPADYIDAAHAITCGLDGNIYASGCTYVSGGHWEDVIVISFDQSGTERWIYTYNGPNDEYDGSIAICYGQDNCIYTAGWIFHPHTFDDLECLAISLDTNGVEKWVYRYHGSEIDHNMFTSLAYGSDGNVYFAGRSADSITHADFTVISIDPGVGIEERNTMVEKHSLGPTILRGPLVLPKDKTCKVFDIIGRVVAPEKVQPGIYFIEVEGKIKQKVVKVR